jgi:hypothetical protein
LKSRTVQSGISEKRAISWQSRFQRKCRRRHSAMHSSRPTTNSLRAGLPFSPTTGN